MDSLEIRQNSFIHGLLQPRLELNQFYPKILLEEFFETGTPPRIRTENQRILNPFALPISVEGQNKYQYRISFPGPGMGFIQDLPLKVIDKRVPSHYA